MEISFETENNQEIDKKIEEIFEEKNLIPEIPEDFEIKKVSNEGLLFI